MKPLLNQILSKTTDLYRYLSLFFKSLQLRKMFISNDESKSISVKNEINKLQNQLKELHEKEGSSEYLKNREAKYLIQKISEYELLEIHKDQKKINEIENMQQLKKELLFYNSRLSKITLQKGTQIARTNSNNAKTNSIYTDLLTIYTEKQPTIAVFNIEESSVINIRDRVKNELSLPRFLVREEKRIKEKEEEKRRYEQRIKREKERKRQEKKRIEEEKERKRLRDIERKKEVELNKKQHRENLAEKDTIWASRLHISKINCFDDIRQLANNQGDECWESLDRGTAILSEYNQLEQFIFSFGTMHKLKLFEAFNDANEIFAINHKNLSIIDWGCGQALATCILIDFLRNNHYTDFTLSQIILIDPSEIACRRGVLHLNSLLDDSENPAVSCLFTSINNVDIDSLRLDKRNLKVHLFSNILDIVEIDLRRLFQVICESSSGDNLFVCVSPSINTYRNQRLDQFMDYFTDIFDSSFIISERDTSIPKPNGSGVYKRYQKVFKVFIN